MVSDFLDNVSKCIFKDIELQKEPTSVSIWT
jgi:hypothetical protein